MNAYASTTNYNDISTGKFEITIEEWMKSNHITIDELIDIDGNELVFQIEWGNGEGHDEIRVEFI